MRLAKTDLLPILRDLAVSMPGAKDRDPVALVDGYYDALDDCSVLEVQTAARAVKRESRFFPAAAMLRRFVLDYRKEHPNGGNGGNQTPAERMDTWARFEMPNGVPCPYCGSVLTFPEGRRGGVWHDEQRHQEARAPIIGHMAGE